jgi:hypothetical protein
LVRLSLSVPVSVFWRITVACGITAALESRTTPLRVAVACAEALCGLTSINTSANNPNEMQWPNPNAREPDESLHTRTSTKKIEARLPKNAPHPKRLSINAPH